MAATCAAVYLSIHQFIKYLKARKNAEPKPIPSRENGKEIIIIIIIILFILFMIYVCLFIYSYLMFVGFDSKRGMKRRVVRVWEALSMYSLVI